jgi:hypothetical protein
VKKIKETICCFFDFVSARFFDGVTPFSSLVVDSTGVLVRLGTTMLEDYELFNNSDTILYVRFYDDIELVDPATDVPVLRVMVPARSGANLALLKRKFSSGLVIRATSGIADTDVASPVADTLIVNLGYRPLWDAWPIL